jgi:hypothetical protein
MLINSSYKYDITVQSLASAYNINRSVKTGVAANYTELAKHVSLDGLGIPEPERRFLAYPAAHGGIDTGFRLKPRQLAWKLFVSASTESAFLTALDNLFVVFKPTTLPLVLTITTPSGAVRKLDCYVNGPVEVAQSTQTGWSAVVTVPLYAPDPTFYASSTTTQSITATTSPSQGSLYGGSWPSWPIIHFLGELVDPRLQLRITTASGSRYYNIDFTGHTIVSGRTYTADLRPGHKTLVDDLGANRLGDLATPATFPQFKIFVAPIDASGGQNIVDLYFTSKSGAARVEFEYVKRYISL